MAQRRMLARSVATSAKLSLIPWFTESLWHRGHPFLDDAGMMDADPEEIKTLLLPRGKNGKQIPRGKIEAALKELEKVGLIVIHSCGICTCLRYTNFEKFQTLRTGRPLQIDCKNPKNIICFPVESIGIQWNPEESIYYLPAREETNGNLVRARGSGSGSEDEKEKEPGARASERGKKTDPEWEQRKRDFEKAVGQPLPPEALADAQDETVMERRRRAAG